MSREHNFRFGRMLENDPTAKTQPDDTKIASYPRESFARNVCFALSDGTLKGLNYSYLVSATFNAEVGELTLEFTSCIVKMRGACLKSLFFDFLEHIPKMIVCSDGRYEVLHDDDQPKVHDIEITQTS